MKPELIDVDDFLVFELIRPLAAMLILSIFPFGSDTLLEQVIVGLETEIGACCDVVLPRIRVCAMHCCKAALTYTPQNSSTESNETTSFSKSFQLSPFDDGGLVN